MHTERTVWDIRSCAAGVHGWCIGRARYAKGRDTVAKEQESTRGQSATVVALRNAAMYGEAASLHNVQQFKQEKHRRRSQ